MAAHADKLAPVQALVNAGSLDQAWSALTRLITIAPRDLAVRRMAAHIRLAQNRPDLAEPHTGAALAIAPRDGDCVNNHAGVLIMLGRQREAVALLQPLVAALPHFTSGRVNLITALLECGRFVQAEGLTIEGLRREPRHPDLLNNIATALHRQGRANEAVGLLQRLLEYHPHLVSAAAAATCFLNYIPDVPPTEVLRAHAQLGSVLATRGRGEPARPQRTPAPGGPVRLGILSTDLRSHSVAFFIEPLFQHLDRSRFDLFVYHTNSVVDDVTKRLRTYPATWRDGVRATESQLTGMIRDDGLDVIVELGGLTTAARLTALASRPAPVQITYLGYPATTGCPFIDVRMVDSITDPPGAEAFSSERLLRLDPCFLCYRPPDDAPPASAPDPGRPFTFGCFGSLMKYNEPLIAAWSRLLARCPGSRLLLKAEPFSDEDVLKRTAERFHKHGVDPARLELLSHTATLRDHLALYDRVDLALDTFPYHGTTTTCEAMLMGVPTVTRIGPSHASRVGLTLLTQVGLTDLAAHTEEEWIAKAESLAGDRPRLANLRATLRQTLLASPLCDGPAFARRFEAGLLDAIATKAAAQAQSTSDFYS